MSEELTLREISSFARSCLRLHLGALDRGGRLENIEAVLCEDQKTVMIYASVKGEWLAVCFDVERPEESDAASIEAAFGRAVWLH